MDYEGFFYGMKNDPLSILSKNALQMGGLQGVLVFLDLRKL